MNPLWWVLWSGMCAIGAGLLVYFVMQSRMEVLLSKQREKLAAAKATIEAQGQAMRDSMKNVEESTRGRALDEFLSELRVEERHYLRTHKVMFMTRKILVRQERIFFRNLPLSDWVEHEMPIEEGVDAERMSQAISVFGGLALREPTEEPVSNVQRLLR